MKTATRFADLPKRYAALVDLLPPRPLHTRQEYEEVVEMIDALAGFDLNKDQEDYLEALSRFVLDYEEKRHPIRKSTPIEVVRDLMDQHGLSISDVGRLLGCPSLGSRILSGERKLNARHISILRDHFGVSADLLLG